MGIKQKAIERVNLYDNIPGRSGHLVEHTGIYESYERTVILADRTGQTDLTSWLNGSGELRFSTEPGGFYKASVIDGYTITPIRGTTTKLIEIIFLIHPFFYLDSGITTTTISGTTSFTNIYGVDAKPLIELSGSNIPKFTFNNKTISVTQSGTGALIVDSELQVCYSKSTFAALKMTGDFPILTTDSNNTFVKGTGTLKVAPRWCKL